MNVAIFTDTDFGSVNDVTTTLTAALSWAPPGLRLRIYTAGILPSHEPDYLSIDAIRMPIPFYADRGMFVPRLRRYVAQARQDRIDVVHLTTPGPVGLAAVYTAWRLGLPLVGSFHADVAAYATVLSGSPLVGSVVREYVRWMYGHCWRVLVPSMDARDLLVSAGTRADRIDVCPRGVDTTLFSPINRSRAMRDRWHVADNRPAILYVGRLSPEKGLDLLPSLQRRLYARGLQHRFILAGDGPMRDALRRQMPDALFTGTLSRRAVAEVFASADALVYPSGADAAANVVLEAQASGLPVVVAGSGAARENMIEGATGIVCRCDEADEWAAVIVRMVPPAARAPFADAARAYALRRQWRHALEPFYRAYRDLCAVGAPTPAGIVPMGAADRL